MQPTRFLAFDLGAESGRAVVGTLANDRLSLEEIQRFRNEPVEVTGTLYWDILYLYSNLLTGMRACAERYGSVESLGIDSWSVDFGLLGEDGALLQNPVCYRDRRTEGMVEEATWRLAPERLYELTGMSLNQIHTAFQMYSLRHYRKPVLEMARTFLMIPDLLAYFLTGEKYCERTNAIHSQLYDPRRREWCAEVFAALELPLAIMPPLVDPGTRIGEIGKSVQRATGLGPTPVIAPCTHDTGSAVAAVPLAGEDAAFLSSGTWSVLGTLTAAPVTTAEAFAARLNNELSLDFFVCRNIMGLWLLQQSRAAWKRAGEEYSYEDLVALAERASRGGPVVFPDAPAFLAPPDMPQAIAEYCYRTGQAPPADIPTTARCILESLALSYRHGLEQFRRILGREFTTLHIVGGGSLNTLLCQLAADATGLPVIAGPVEATVAGNVLVQALASGYLESVEHLREVVRGSFSPVQYEPRPNEALEEQYEKYVSLL